MLNKLCNCNLSTWEEGLFAYAFLNDLIPDRQVFGEKLYAKFLHVRNELDNVPHQWARESCQNLFLEQKSISVGNICGE